MNSVTYPISLNVSKWARLLLVCGALSVCHSLKGDQPQVRRPDAASKLDRHPVHNEPLRQAISGILPGTDARIGANTVLPGALVPPPRPPGPAGAPKESVIGGSRIVEKLSINQVTYIPQRPLTRLPAGPGDPPPLPPGGIQVSQAFEGIDFFSSDCGCLPPDTGAAVGGNFIIETVNTHIRIFDKSTGAILLDESLAAFFGAPSSGDPYVVYDDIANRWYVVAFNNGANGLFLAVSQTANPLDGFLPTLELTGVGGFPDYPKMGFNRDAIFVSYNDFGGGTAAATVATIDKAAALSGSLVYYVSVPNFQFRAMPPAQMHGDTAGGVEWFVSTDGNESFGNTIRVTKMENYLSDSPTFTYWSLPVIQYQAPYIAEQPGGSVTVFPNTTTTQVHYRNGHLVTAMSSGQAPDGYAYPKGLYYQVDLAGGTPVLLREGVIDPGPGIAVMMPSVDEDAGGNLGLTWMQSSATEYLSMWVGAVDAGGTVAGKAVAPGGGFFPYSFRIGDYSTIVLDPTDSRTFWAANEYIGPDGDSDIWRTYIAAFNLGMGVTSTSPAQGQFVSAPPSEYGVQFSSPFDPASVDASDLVVNGVPASAVSVVDERTLSFTFNSSPVVVQGPQTLTLPAGAVTRLSDGDPVGAYTATFYYDAVRLQVTSSVPADGSIATLPLKSIVLSFNEPFDPATVSTSDLAVSVGFVTTVDVVDATTLRFNVDGIVSEGVLNFSVPAGSVTDVYGNPGLPYQATVTLDYAVEPFPVPALAVKPAGGLIYETGFRGTVFPAGDTDVITIDVDPGQTLTVIATPEEPTLRPQVTLTSDGLPTSSATAPAPGKRAVIQTYKGAGTLWASAPPARYSVTVGGADGSTGAYSVRLVLNAAVESEEYDGPANDSPATAQILDSSFIAIGTAAPKPERGAVLGRAITGAMPGDAWVAVRGYGFYGGSVVRYNAAGEPVQTIISPEFNRGIISDVELGPGNVIYVALCTQFLEDEVQGEVLRFDLLGNYLGSIPLPDDKLNLYYVYPFGFDVAADGTLWVAQLNTGNVIHVSPGGDLIGSYPVGLQPQDVSVSPDASVLVSFIDFNTFTGQVLRLDPSTGNTSVIVPYVYNPVDINATPDGGAWLGDFNDSLRLDAAGNITQYLFEYGSIDAQQDPNGNVWIAAYFNGVAKYDSAGNFLLRQYPPDGYPLGIAVAGTDSSDPLPPPPSDYYSLSLKAGQTVAVTASLTEGSPVSVQLLSPAGGALAGGTASRGTDCLIPELVAASTGTYLIKVSGNGAYSLVVNRNSSFDDGSNGSIASAQPLIVPGPAGPHRVLGYLAPSGLSFTDGFYSPDGLVANGSAGFFMGLAYLTQGSFGEAGSVFSSAKQDIRGFSSSFIFMMTPGTWPMADGMTFTIQGNSPNDLGPAGGGLGYGPDYPDPSVRGIGNSVAVKFDIYDNAGEGINSTGLYTDGRSPTVPEPGSGDILVDLTGTGIDLHSQAPFQVDLEYSGTTLNVTITDLFTFASATQSYTIDIPARVGGSTAHVGFTGGTGGLSANQFLFAWVFNPTAPSEDFYKVELKGNKTVRIETETPAGGRGELVNELDPWIRLHDAAGQVVATADNNLPDRRNARIDYKVPAGPGGTYYISVGPSPMTAKPTRGEYILNQSQ